MRRFLAGAPIAAALAILTLSDTAFADQELGRPTSVDVFPDQTVVGFITISGIPMTLLSPPTSQAVLDRLLAPCHPDGFLAVEVAGDGATSAKCVDWDSAQAPAKSSVEDRYWKAPVPAPPAASGTGVKKKDH